MRTGAAGIIHNMSAEGINRLLRDMRDRPGFVQQIAQDASIATGYDITADEREALLRADPGELRSLGVDEGLLDLPPLIGRANR